MNKVIITIFCGFIMAIYAERPSWYPENDTEVNNQCYEENQLEPGFIADSSTFDELTSNKNVQEAFLCYGKRFNFYSEDTGIDIERMVYSIYKRERDCKKPVAQECVDKFKDVDAAGEMILKVIHCTILHVDTSKDC
ncbi:uncharacterized protein LOC119612176 [Lucilia sericata]|uniref:uncharacterized protein LOC119612176 n=1 Tax=Lucilia sericata TaxID=13632 RepID=UPI0018A86CDA|nr:uncharacterized protein LOC119612176 [Lucilia sericata]